jgi:signal transduction histidine kinase
MKPNRSKRNIRRGSPRVDANELYIMRLLVAQMGGKIWTESEGTGKGCTFWIRFPTKRQN